MSSAATPAEREAFETATAISRAIVIDRTPVAAVAAYWGITPQQAASRAITHFTGLIYQIAEAANAPADVAAAIEALEMFGEPDED